MKLVTFEQGGKARPGIWLGDKVIDITAADSKLDTMLAFIAAGDKALTAAKAWSAAPPSGATLDAKAVKLLAPIPRPTKNVFCIGRNYLDHVKEGHEVRGTAVDLPKAPQIFTKPPTAVIGPDAEASAAKSVTAAFDYEVELGVIIGKKARDISKDSVFDHIFGYTVINDLTARDLQSLHGQWFRGKGLDTSCPIGPWIVTKDEIADVTTLELTCTVNGERRQNATVDMMIFDIPTIVSTLASGMTLEPGDIIATGTPAGVGFAMKPPKLLNEGDVVVCEVSQIGSLKTTIRRP
jgi:2-keto-4-pentenoate hydratase/2-oxohepta-3-ene-1,7-dioic acid hydratase in catechol pathway